ncbi:MAG TPA: biopolymer transporter ExbD [Prolixibacteraceae bacterium]|nr:biopolymer transporter ExbD [Prolixibacteraceae bacterium]
MSKFRKSNAKETPAVSTASLPDIVFMLLFFFMVTTTMRQVSLKVRTTIPTATELTKLERKSLVSYIYVGPPQKQYIKVFGTEPRIQLNDQFAKVSDIPDFIIAERAARDEAEIPFMVTSLKVDEFTKMQIVGDIKQELRKAAALHINYSSRKAVENK